MEFSDRKTRFKKFRKTDQDGEPLSEEFFALITDEVTEEGTPLNAENLNKGNWRDDDTISFASYYGASINPQPFATQLYTAKDGETWLVPPAGQKDRYQLSAGHKALNTLCDPTTGHKTHLQNIINNSFYFYSRSCTADMYDNLELSAEDYGNYNINMLDFDLCGELILAGGKRNPSGYGLFDLRDPTTGQKDFLQNIIYNIFYFLTDAETNSFKAGEYDFYQSGTGIRRDFYESKNITARNFDLSGKTFF